MEAITETQRRWVEAVLANDENSTDEDLLAYFIENELSEPLAVAAIARRGDALRSI